MEFYNNSSLDMIAYRKHHNIECNEKIQNHGI